jgi:hypothetical protein
MKEEQAGVTMTDVLSLPDELRVIVTWLMRQGEAELSDVAALIEQDNATAHALLAELIAQGFVQKVVHGVEGQPRYRVRLAAKRGKQLPLGL